MPVEPRPAPDPLLAGSVTVTPSGPLTGDREVPGDKSVSHRAVLFGALTPGVTRVTGLSTGEDVGRTTTAVRALGATVATRQGPGGAEIHVQGGPWRDVETIDCGNSGTSARLLLGALAGRATTTLVGDSSLSRRPMRRVLAPLRTFGASVIGTAAAGDDHLPLTVQRRRLQGGVWRAELASAQVKSAVLLAGLDAAGPTTYVEPLRTRDHTERLLLAMGARLTSQPEPDGARRITIEPGPLSPVMIEVPGDLSAAAFWIVAACLVPGSRLRLTRVGLNPTRAGVLAVLRRMGARLTISEVPGRFEPIGDVLVESGPLRGTVVAGAEVPLLIDEVPILAIAAAFAEGETVFRDAGELRVKETDRIATTVAMVRALGVDAEPLPDGLIVRGGRPRAGVVHSDGDHRIAMAGAIAGLVVGAEVRGTDCVRTSYPAFFDILGGYTRVLG